jgi:hypothetical protein
MKIESGYFQVADFPQPEEAGSATDQGDALSFIHIFGPEGPVYKAKGDDALVCCTSSVFRLRKVDHLKVARLIKILFRNICVYLRISASICVPLS